MPHIPTHELEQRLEQLPPLPESATRALEELGRNNVDFAKLERAIGGDPVLTARVLRVANSPFYGLPRKIVAIKDACILTGAPTLRNLIVASVALQQFPANQGTQLDRAMLWKHSAQCAAFAAELALLAHQPRDMAFTAGLLHDIGKLALDALLPQEYAHVLARGGGVDAEMEVLGTTHADIGARVADVWRLPPAIRDAIAGHHAPALENRATPADVIYAADVLSHGMSDGLDGIASWSQVRHDVCARLGLAEHERNDVYARSQTLAATATALFDTP